jgi:hypothetical protein
MRHHCETRGSLQRRGLIFVEFLRPAHVFPRLASAEDARTRPRRENSSFSLLDFRSLLNFWMGARKCAEFCCAGQGFRVAQLK